ncbi:phage baseplate assembly protein V [Stenotrophomonas sp. MMGLT7]|uniref:phage baseplate assembly protein V n=1 Tax=Stenotrophomonas sp. MMGLT7 TaxID=2901227 RepID=UPI001E3D8635|nr:phage baseplate assembly protein V [Stenotrophomonas sp. MMGLT7]MCD7096981.1 phage baseplate assembly protein V [Stenotrophomonas sp. MMGLT7]
MRDSDLPRRVSNLIRIGTISAVDLGAARVRVESGDVLTDWLPWLVPHAGAGRVEWSPPSVGEQVLVLCAEGEAEAGIVLRGLYSDAVPAPAAAAGLHQVRFSDGAVVEYDAEAHLLNATLPPGGSATITAAAGVTINGPLTVNGDSTLNGDVACSATVTAQTDVIGAGISLVNHKTTGVTPGSGLSGAPQ